MSIADLKDTKDSVRPVEGSSELEFDALVIINENKGKIQKYYNAEFESLDSVDHQAKEEDSVCEPSKNKVSSLEIIRSKSVPSKLGPVNNNQMANIL